MRGDGTEAGRRAATWWWVGALALLLVASGSGVFRSFGRTDTDRGEAVRRAVLGGLVGLALAGVLVAGWAWYRKRHGMAAGALGASLLAAMAAFLIAASAAIGASTTPPQTPAPPRSTPSSAPGSGGGDPTVEPNGGYLDARTGLVYVDSDGDGMLDTQLVSCPTPTTTRPGGTSPGGTAPAATTSTLPPYRVGDTVRVLLDYTCDGVIDAIIYVEVRARVDLPGTTPTTTTAPRPGPDDPGSDDGDGASGLVGTIVIVVLLLLAAAVVAVMVMRVSRRRRGRLRRQGAAPPAVDPAAAELDDEIDTEAAAESFAASGRILVDDPDPRTAIIAAYASLLEGLDAAGAGRRPHEAPEEHLQRSMRQLQVPPDALSAVTRLFLVARFSSHPLGERERAQAKAALREAEQCLRTIAVAHGPESS